MDTYFYFLEPSPLGKLWQIFYIFLQPANVFFGLTAIIIYCYVFQQFSPKLTYHYAL
jgi:hypothetical protein